jgi:hypothetical protein
MWYGLTKKNIISGLIIFVLIGAVAVLLALVSTLFKDPGSRNYWALLFLFVVVPGIWLVLVSILSATWLRVDKEHVEWYLWKKIHLLKCPIADITHIGGGSFSAVIIKTKKGTIRLLGLHHRDRKKLSSHLMELNQSIKWLK